MKSTAVLIAVFCFAAAVLAIETNTRSQGTLSVDASSASEDEPKYELDFVGTATDNVARWSENGKKFERVRQIGRGHLTVSRVHANGTKTEVERVSAASGPMNNGLLPNGKWTALAPIDARNSFPDESGKYGYKMILTPADFKLQGRSAFLIHSVQQHGANATEGCIGLNGGHAENVRFFDLMLAYFKYGRSLVTNVNITGNANIGWQLGTSTFYNDTSKKPNPKPVAPKKKTAPAKRSLF